MIAGTPIPTASDDWLQRRLEQGIAECCRSGVYPIAWETPHYAAGQRDYRVISGFFDTFHDRPMVADIPDSQVLSPYSFRLGDMAVQVIPENLGYISLDNRPRDTAALLVSLDNMSVVRDGLAAFFFHPFLPLEDLQRLAEGRSDDYLRVRVKAEAPTPGLADRDKELLPNALDVSVDHPREAGAQPERGKGRGKLAPAQLFAAYYEHRNQTPPPAELQKLFDAIHEEAAK